MTILYTFRNKLYIFIFITLSCFINVFINANKNDEQPILNVFVHGVCNIDQNFHPISLFNIIYDDIYYSYYHHNISTFRKKSYMYQFQAMQQVGLHPITDSSPYAGNSCGALVHVFNETWKKLGVGVKKNIYYTFGWSGLHSIKEYKKAGKNLYNSLTSLLKDLSEEGVHPTVRIWGYSYGGAVTLMMAEADLANSLHVQDLILIGVPFLKETIPHIKSSLFKRVYNIYSRGDKVQPYDLIAPTGFWCERKLTKKSINPIPQNLIQVELVCTVPSQHALRSPKSFQHSFDLTNKKILARKSPLLHTIYPGHIELWLFGWTYSYYRSTLITYPLPIAAISLPYALTFIPSFLEHHNPKDHYIIDVRPTHEYVLINKKTAKEGTYNLRTAPFFNQEQFKSFKANAMLYAPTNVDPINYLKQIDLINQEALITWNQKDHSTLLV